MLIEIMNLSLPIHTVAISRYPVAVLALLWKLPDTKVCFGLIFGTLLA